MLIFLKLCAYTTANPDAKRLYDDLLSNYNRLIRPVRNNTETVLVKLGLRLSQLIDLVSKLFVWFTVQYTMECMHLLCNVKSASYKTFYYTASSTKLASALGAGASNKSPNIQNMNIYVTFFYYCFSAEFKRSNFNHQRMVGARK